MGPSGHHHHHRHHCLHYFRDHQYDGIDYEDHEEEEVVNDGDNGVVFGLDDANVRRRRQNTFGSN